MNQIKKGFKNPNSKGGKKDGNKQNEEGMDGVGNHFSYVVFLHDRCLCLERCHTWLH
jgi:hypothetical protein